MNYIVFDLEATCQENDRSWDNETIEIGAVKLNEKLEIVDEFCIFVKPVVNIKLTNFCKQLTSIEQKDVDSAVLFPEAIEKFKEWVGKDYWLCSWGFYDKNQFEKDCNRYNLDTKWLKNHISIKHQHQEIKGLKKGVGIRKALSWMKLDFEGIHHRGIDDAKNIAKVFKNIFNKLKF